MEGYGWLIVLGIILVAAIVLIIKDKSNAKKWLLYAVALAETELGSGTGELKLQMVYNEFVEKFPIAAKFVSFNGFKKLVDQALEALKDMMNKNDKIKSTIEEG